ncbi:MAG: ribosome maturation factor RimP [bacterium]|nr:ribosome maturation factor RimP [bacterium]
MTEVELKNTITKVAEDAGFDIVEIKIEQRSRLSILKIFIDKDGGISIDDCKKVSRELNDYFFTHDLIKEEYRLEVSSPGADRELKTVKDFERQVSRKLRIQYDGEDKAESFEGVLESVSPEEIVLKGNKKEFKLDFKRIISAKIILPW